MDCTPSHAQAIKMRQMSEAKTGDEAACQRCPVSPLLKEEKPNQKRTNQKFRKELDRQVILRRGRPRMKIEDTIVQALELLPQTSTQFRTIIPLTREKYAHLPGANFPLPLSTPHCSTSSLTAQRRKIGAAWFQKIPAGSIGKKADMEKKRRTTSHTDGNQQS
ncbi:MAG: hypothetical protein ACLTLQ_10905 [[Clostridium] scindens]